MYARPARFTTIGLGLAVAAAGGNTNFTLTAPAAGRLVSLQFQFSALKENVPGAGAGSDYAQNLNNGQWNVTVGNRKVVYNMPISDCEVPVNEEVAAGEEIQAVLSTIAMSQDGGATVTATYAI